MQPSIWPLVAAALAALLIGYAWYHPRLFGRLWLRASGVTPEHAESMARGRHFALAGLFLAALILAYGMRVAFVAFGALDLYSAVRLGAFLWLVFAFPIFLSSAFNEQRFTLHSINAGYWLCAFVSMAAVLIV